MLYAEQKAGNISAVLVLSIALIATVFLVFAKQQAQQNDQTHTDNVQTTNNNISTIETVQKVQPITFDDITMDTAQWKEHNTNYVKETEYDGTKVTNTVFGKLTFKYPPEFKVDDFATKNGIIWIRAGSAVDNKLPISMEIKLGSGAIKGGISPRTAGVQTLPFATDSKITKMSTDYAVAYFLNYNYETFERDAGFQMSYLDRNLTQEEKKVAETIMDEIVKSFRFVE